MAQEDAPGGARSLTDLQRAEFRALGLLAHTIGDMRRHREVVSAQTMVLRRRTRSLVRNLTPEDRVEVEAALSDYAAIAEAHPDGSVLCIHHSFHSEARLLQEETYLRTGLAADLDRLLQV